MAFAACGGSSGKGATTSTTEGPFEQPGTTVGKSATLEEVRDFGSNPGDLRMFEYVPTGLAPNRPIVVALHGCTQSADGFDNETGWTKWADAMGFALVLPQQTAQNNGAKCFQFWLAGDASRGQGEAASIKQMVDSAASRYESDPRRVFVTGLSAGAAMTNVMLATYPDVFRGGAPVAGVAFQCATNAPETAPCNNGTVDKTPAEWGELVRRASSWKGPWPAVSIWHGTTDATVSIQNLRETMEQWTNVNGIDQVPDVNDTISGFPHVVYKDRAGTALVETFSVTGMGHGQPTDPGSGARQCGVGAPYFLDVDVCASYAIAAWFGVNA